MLDASETFIASARHPHLNERMSFVDRLARLIEARGTNKSKVARALGVTPQGVGQWANGKTTPQGDNLIQLAAFLDTTPAYLLYGEGDSERTSDQGQTSSGRSARTLGSRLRLLRAEHRMRQEDVAAVLKMPRAQLDRIENDLEEPDGDTIVGLGSFYKVSPGWLASGRGKKAAVEAGALVPKEDLLVSVFRALPQEEANAHLDLLLRRARRL